MSKVDLRTLLQQLAANDNTKPAVPPDASAPKPARPVKPPPPPRMNRALRPRRRT